MSGTASGPAARSADAAMAGRAGPTWADRSGRSASVRGFGNVNDRWNGAAQASRAVSGAACGANSARNVAGMLAWSWVWPSTVPAETYGDTTTAGTRGPSMVKSNAGVRLLGAIFH